MPRSRVEYWEKWGGTERQAMEAVVDAFNRVQDKHEVVIGDVGDWSSSPDLPRFLSAQEAGAPPDLIGLEDHQIADLASLGALVPLEPWEHLSSCRHEFTSLGFYSGATYGVPVSVDLVTLYVGLSAVSGSRLESGSLPSGPEELGSELARLEESGVVGLVPSYPGWWPQAWARFFGGGWTDPDGRFAPDRSENVRAFDWVRGVRDRLASLGEALPEGVRPLLSASVNPIGRRRPDPFLSGDVAMVLEGDWLVRRLIAVPGFQWRPAAFPGVDGRPVCLIVGDLLAIPAGAANPVGALEFARFATRPEQLERLAFGHGKISPLGEWSSRFTSEHPNPHVRTFRDILDSATLLADPRIPGWLNFLDRVKAAFASVWLEGHDPAGALARLRSVPRQP